MEYLQYSMIKVLRNHDKSIYWLSAFIQIWAGVSVALHHYNFIHNDLHCNNVRVRSVSDETFLYYKTSDGTLLKVPTFGYVYVLIDFGRSFISLDKTNPSTTLVSSEFKNGNCTSFEPDNPCIDVVRLISSIESDVDDLISDKNERLELKQLFRIFIENDRNMDLLKEWNSKKNENNLFYYIDKLPRIICKKFNSFQVIPYFYKYFKVNTIPNEIIPFFIPLNS